MAKRGDVRIELLRVVGALSVFAYHFMGDVEATLRPAFGPTPVWAAVRAGCGPFGVALFVIISGVVFTWSWMNAATRGDFVRRRLAALFPLYWWIALPLIALALAVGKMPASDLWKVPIWLTGLGIVSPTTFFPIVDGWWYMTLALQIVVAFPFLRLVQDRLGTIVFMLVAAAVTLASVWALQTLGLDYAIQGFVGCRLAELAVGMTIGRYVTAGSRGWPRASELGAMVLALTVCAAGWPGTQSQLALAPAVVVIVVGFMANPSSPFGRRVVAAGGLSFAFYLSHSPWIKPVTALVVSIASLAGVQSQAMATVLAGVLSLTVAVLVAWGFQRTFTVATGLGQPKSATSRDSTPGH